MELCEFTSGSPALKFRQAVGGDISSSRNVDRFQPSALSPTPQRHGINASLAAKLTQRQNPRPRCRPVCFKFHARNCSGMKWPIGGRILREDGGATGRLRRVRKTVPGLSGHFPAQSQPQGGFVLPLQHQFYLLGSWQPRSANDNRLSRVGMFELEPLTKLAKINKAH